MRCGGSVGGLPSRPRGDHLRVSGISGVIGKAKAEFAQLQQRWPWLGHLMRALKHYSVTDGNTRAASVTYFGFLSFFPIIALAFAILGYVGRVYPAATSDALQGIDQYLPGLIGNKPNQLNIQSIAGAAGAVSVFGLLGLLYSGLGWVDALRESLHRMWGTQRPQGNMFKQKAVDVLVLIVLGIAVLVSVAISSLATSATNLLLGAIGLEHNLGASILLKLIALVIAAAVDFGVILFLFTRLNGRNNDTRVAVPGAIVGAVLLEILKLAGTFLIGRTTSNPVYGTFAVIVGLLVWINFLARAVLLSASWTVTTAGGPFAHGPAEDQGAPQGSQPVAAPVTQGGDVPPEVTGDPPGPQDEQEAMAGARAGRPSRAGKGAATPNAAARDAAANPDAGRNTPSSPNGAVASSGRVIDLRDSSGAGRRQARVANGETEPPSRRAAAAVGMVAGVALGVLTSKARKGDGSAASEH